jgi:hypothetical protein
MYAEVWMVKRQGHNRRGSEPKLTDEEPHNKEVRTRGHVLNEAMARERPVAERDGSLLISG